MFVQTCWALRFFFSAFNSAAVFLIYLELQYDSLFCQFNCQVRISFSIHWIAKLNRKWFALDFDFQFCVASLHRFVCTDKRHPLDGLMMLHTNRDNFYFSMLLSTVVDMMIETWKSGNLIIIHSLARFVILQFVSVCCCVYGNCDRNNETRKWSWAEYYSLNSATNLSFGMLKIS